MRKLFTGQFDYIHARKICWYITLGLMVVGLLFNIIFGTEMDISFKGGTLVKYSYSGTADTSAVAFAIETATGHKVDVQTSESAGIALLNVYTTDVLTMDDQQAITDALNKAYPDGNFHAEDASSLTASKGKMFFVKCLVAVALASAFLVLYVAIRFRKIGGWTAGVMALVALLHDLAIAYFAFVIFRIPLNDNFVAVLLTILGYSLNDTLVTYDRIRENRTLMRDADLPTIVNDSLNQCFRRNVNTALSTVIAVGTVAVVALVMRLDSITSFAIPMLFGLISGFYSSTFLCAPTWVLWEEKREAKAALKAKAKGKGKRK